MTRNFRFQHLLGVLALGVAFLGGTARAEESTSGTMTITGGVKPTASALSSSVSTQVTPEQAAQLKAGTVVTLNGERVGELEKVDYSKESGQARLKIKIDNAAKVKFASGGSFDVKAGEVPIKMTVTRTGANLKANRDLKRVEDVKIETKPEAEKKAKESSAVTPKASLDQLASSVSELSTWASSAPEATAVKADIAALETSVKGLDANQNLIVATNEVVRQARDLSSKLQDAGLGEKAENLDEAVAELRITLARTDIRS